MSAARRGARRFLAPALALALLAGCAPGEVSAPAPSPDPSERPRPTTSDATPHGDALPDDTPRDATPPDAATVRADGVLLIDGPATVHLLTTPSARLVRDDAAAGLPGAPVTVVVAGEEAGSAAAHLAVAAGWTADVLGDGSVVIRDVHGTAVGGLVAPVADADGTGRAAWFAAGEAPSLLRLVVGPPAKVDGGSPPGGPVTVRTALATAAIEGATWGEQEGGRSLAVVPAPWLRGGSEAAVEVAWARLVAEEPETDAPGMRHQLACHALGARDKATWNLEPWRPDVGALGTLLAECNPT